MKILVAHNGSVLHNRPVETYARSMIRVLRERGHDVVESPKHPPKASAVYDSFDLLLDIDCGRDAKGELRWHGEKTKPNVKSAVYYIDSHGNPTMHKRMAKNYDHVFFAVWDKRDLFIKHPSAHWCPNFTDLQWFNGEDYLYPSEDDQEAVDFGFFGSKGGLARADKLIEVCNDSGRYTHRVAQICAGGKHRWPHTAQAMANCRYLFNHGQKHDGPNLRVMESMAMLRPLVNDYDIRSGMGKLFTSWEHYVPYQSYTYTGLKEALQFCIDNPKKADDIAYRAFLEVKNKHLVGNRIDQILEVAGE